MTTAQRLSGHHRRPGRHRRHQGGFTLIELLVVIAVLAILAAIVIFNVATAADRGRTESCKTDLQTIQTAAQAYYNDNHSSWPTAGHTVPGALVPADLVGTYVHSTATQLMANTGVVTLDANGTATAANC